MVVNSATNGAKEDADGSEVRRNVANGRAARFRRLPLSNACGHNGRTIGGPTGWDGSMVDLAHLTLADAARMIAARELSSLDLVEATFARIAAFDTRLDSHVTLMTESALAAARAADAEIAAGRRRGPLHGGRVAPGDCSPEALTRSGQGDFHHPAPPLMCLVATPPISARQPAAGEAGSVPAVCRTAPT